MLFGIGYSLPGSNRDAPKRIPPPPRRFGGQILLNQKGQGSNFTIWNKDEYIFGYCEMVKELDYPPTPAQQAASTAWEKKQLEIMDWLTDDADAITGQSHGKAIRIFP